jgi:hypothetical protein
MHQLAVIRRYCLPVRAVLTALGAVLLGGLSVSAVDDYALWGNWRNIYLITNANGAKVTTGNVYNVPVLIRLNPANFDGLGNTSDAGADIRFSKADGTHLYYEIERWTHTSATNDTAEIWVLVDTVFSNDTTTLKMYWNRGSAADSTSPTSVFETTNGFAGVWHLNENPGGGSNCIKDRTTNAHDGTPQGTIGSSNMYSTGGIIGPALNFDGSTNYINLATPSTLVFGNADLTISAWIYTSSTSARGIVMKTNNGTHETGDKLFGVSYGSDTRFGIDHGWVTNCEGTSNVTNSAWHYIVWKQQNAYSGGNEGWWLYVDGAQENSKTAATLNDVAGHTVQIGQLASSSYR